MGKHLEYTSYSLSQVLVRSRKGSRGPRLASRVVQALGCRSEVDAGVLTSLSRRRRLLYTIQQEAHGKQRLPCVERKGTRPVKRPARTPPGVLCCPFRTYDKLTIGISSATMHIGAAREHCKTGGATCDVQDGSVRSLDEHSCCWRWASEALLA